MNNNKNDDKHMKQQCTLVFPIIEEAGLVSENVTEREEKEQN